MATHDPPSVDLTTEVTADQGIDFVSDTSLKSGLIVGAVGGLVVGVAGVALALITGVYYNGLSGLKDDLMSPGTLLMTFGLYFLAGMVGNALNHYFSITYKLGLDVMALQAVGWVPPTVGIPTSK